MNRFVAIAFAVLLICLTQLPDEVLTAPTNSTETTENPTECRRNEEATSCVSCSATCERPIPGRCNGPLCRPGCKCKFGYFKDSDGDCVSIIGCVIDFLKNQQKGSVFEFINTVKQPPPNK
ncbi:uncharacterized protein LOC144467665 [Augochlora pura]